MDRQIYSFLKKLRRRLGLQKAFDIFPLFLAAGCVPAFLNVCYGYFRPFYYADKIGILWIFLGFLTGMIYFLLHFPKETDAAHTGDRVIGHERLLTALELRGNESAVSHLQKEDTIQHISNCNFKNSFPYQFSLCRISAFLLIFFLFLLFLLLPSDAKNTASKLHKVRQQAKKEINLLEELQKDIDKALTEPLSDSSPVKELTSNNKLDDFESLLEDAKKEYASAVSEKDLTKTKERLEAKINRMSANAKTDAEKNEIASLASSAGLSTANTSLDYNEKSSGNKNTAKKASNTSSDSSSQTENSENNQKDSDADNNSIDNGNFSKNESSNSNSSSSQNSSSGNNQNQNGSSGNNSSSPDRNNNSSDNNTNNNSGSGTQNNNNGSNSNQNNSSNKENPNSNGNRNSNHSGNGSEQGSGKGSGTGTGYNYGSKKGIERKNNTSQSPEQITIMEESVGNDENLTGKASKDGNSYTQSDNSTLNSGVKKDFEEVISSYTQNAYSAIENNKVPQEMTDVVKNYFSNLSS